jgi:predicted 3-demethylubiquinone-9 3-methyltransferase (glyoxalase superfamily)
MQRRKIPQDHKEAEGMVQKITPFLWFDSQAEGAARFYTSVFRASAITRVTHYDEASARASGRPAGSVMTVAFTLDGQDFVALNGGPAFKFSESVSFVVNCDTQDELDRIWERLTDGGQAVQCGWLKDKYGVSWQVVPTNLAELVGGPDPAGSRRATAALMQMVKIDMAALRQAYRQAPSP